MMKSSLLLLFFLLICISILGCIVIYEYFKIKELKGIILLQDNELDRLYLERQHFTKE